MLGLLDHQREVQEMLRDMPQILPPGGAMAEVRRIWGSDEQWLSSTFFQVKRVCHNPFRVLFLRIAAAVVLLSC